jgi:hypothetical protein
MVDISISKSYLAMVFCLVICYEIITLLFGNGFWGSQVALILLIMYLLHEPAHAFMALWYGIDVLEIHLDRKNSYTMFASVDENDPHKNEIEGMIFAAGFAVDITALILIVGVCMKTALSNFSLVSVVPIIFALILSYIFLYGLNRKDCDYQKFKEKVPDKAGA